MKSLNTAWCFVLILVLTSAGPCLGAPQVATPAAQNPSSDPVSSPQTGAVSQQLDECRKKLEFLKGSSAQVATAWCGKASSTKYLSFLKERNDFCRGILLSAADQAAYKKFDQDLANFAERCDCRIKLETIRANIQTAKKILESRCFNGKDSYESASEKVKTIVLEWDAVCKGIVSAPFQQDFVAAQNEFGHLSVELARDCRAAGACEISLEAYKGVMGELQKIRNDRCKGKLHEALGSAASLDKSDRNSCESYRSETKKLLDQYSDQQTSTVKYCSSASIVMFERCPLTREVKRESSKTVASFSKRTEGTVYEYWCAHEADMPWCKKYDGGKIIQEKDWYAVAGSKETVYRFRRCVPPSEWKDKCKAYTSSGKCIPKD